MKLPIPRSRRSVPVGPVPSGPTDSSVVEATDPIAESDRLVAQGDLAGAIDLLAATNRVRRDPELAIRLVDLRLGAARDHGPGQGREPWPPVYDDPFPGHSGSVPVVDARDLTTAVLGGAVAHHGALHVRRLFSPEQVDRSIETIDRAHEVRQEVQAGRASPNEIFSPVEVERPMKTRMLRRMVAEQGGTWLADSPTGTAVVLEALHQVGAVAMMAEHFGEPPVFSLQKSTLRRSAPEPRLVAWHQDGSFLDPEVRTMNIWVALTACGGDIPTPALEVVPRRMADILPVEGVLSPHAVDEDLVASVTAETPSVVPEFAPGDALVFDEHLLHRTHLTLEMTHARYALECWFFAPSHRTENYLPLLA